MVKAFRRPDIGAAILAGLIASLAYAATMELDRKVTKSKVDDLVLVGRPFVPDRPDLARPVGLAVHLANGTALALAYAVLAHDRWPGPAWLRGALFLNLENLALYPIMLFSNHHPAVKDGQMDNYWTWPAFAESLPPHTVYGLLIGPLYERLRGRR
ncbi:MAG: hypothetical protein ACR2LS_01250 [Thermomicrobiales bacterium]